MTRKRRLLLAFLSAAWVGMVLACGGVDHAQVQKKLDGADASWDHGEKADAVRDYRTVYADALPAEKERILPRIVEFEMKAGDINEAKTWIRRGLDDKLNIAYTDPAAKELFAVAKKEQDEAQAVAAKKAEEEKAEAARKVEEEYDAGGLILLRKTVKGEKTEVGIEITGTVVNRRTNKLGYAQITFNVYDKSGAQVGSALANINGLEPGGKWNFKAVAFSTNADTYKFSDLSGF